VLLDAQTNGNADYVTTITLFAFYKLPRLGFRVYNKIKKKHASAEIELSNQS